MRLPVQSTLKSRQGDTSKDVVIKNGYVEIHKSGKMYTVKRPGLAVMAEGAGTAHGAFYYDNIVYSWDSETPNSAPLQFNSYPPYGLSSYSFWSSSTSYTTESDPVVYNNEDGGLTTWYAQRDSTGVTPTEGDDWSTSPFEQFTPPGVMWAKFDVSGVRETPPTTLQNSTLTFTGQSGPWVNIRLRLVSLAPNIVTGTFFVSTDTSEGTNIANLGLIANGGIVATFNASWWFMFSETLPERLDVWIGDTLIISGLSISTTTFPTSSFLYGAGPADGITFSNVEYGV